MCDWILENHLVGALLIQRKKSILIICDRICEKVPFPHILHTSKQNDNTWLLTLINLFVVSQCSQIV